MVRRSVIHYAHSNPEQTDFVKVSADAAFRGAGRGPYMKIQARCLIDNALAFQKKEEERRLRVEWVSERRSRINTVLIH